MEKIKRTILAALIILSPLVISAFKVKNLPNMAYRPMGTVLDSVKFTAGDSVYTDVEHKIVKLYGKASLTSGNFSVQADYIEYNKLTKKGKAVGSVVMYNATENIIGRSAEAIFMLR